MIVEGKQAVNCINPIEYKDTNHWAIQTQLLIHAFAPTNYIYYIHSGCIIRMKNEEILTIE